MLYSSNKIRLLAIRFTEMETAAKHSYNTPGLYLESDQKIELLKIRVMLDPGEARYKKKKIAKHSEKKKQENQSAGHESYVFPFRLKIVKGEL